MGLASPGVGRALVDPCWLVVPRRSHASPPGEARLAAQLDPAAALQDALGARGNSATSAG